jgi:RNA polymerase sigma factor (sigma-70 family)
LDRFEHIIEGCRAGDRKAQNELYRLFAGKMFALCLRYARDYDEAKDNLQDGFISVYRHIDQFQFKGSFEGWIRRIMVNTSLQKYRSQFLLYPLTGQEKNEDLSIENVSELMSEQDLLALIQELPPRYKLVFNMYAIEGYSHKEIASLLGITEGTSKSNLSRARDILQDKLKKQMEPTVNIG